MSRWEQAIDAQVGRFMSSQKSECPRPRKCRSQAHTKPGLATGAIIVDSAQLVAEPPRTARHLRSPPRLLRVVPPALLTLTDGSRVEHVATRDRSASTDAIHERRDRSTLPRTQKADPSSPVVTTTAPRPSHPPTSWFELAATPPPHLTAGAHEEVGHCTGQIQRPRTYERDF